MNLSRRSLLRSLIAAPAVIAVEQLMPVRLWVPTIYGDAIHDDYEGLTAWLKGEKVNILPRGFGIAPDCYHIGEGTFRLSQGLDAPTETCILGSGVNKTILQGDPYIPYAMRFPYRDGKLSEFGKFSVKVTSEPSYLMTGLVP